MRKKRTAQRRFPLGSALKELRKRKGLKQTQVPEAMSGAYSDRSYRRVEAGQLCPDRAILISILKVGLQERDVATINRVLASTNYEGLTEDEAAELNAHPLPQLTRWGPTDGKPPGLCINSCTSGSFIPWDKLREEIVVRVLRQVRNVPVGSTLALGEFRGRKNWIVQVLNPRGEEFANIWFGTNPLQAWAYDGFVRIGPHKAQGNPPKPIVWQEFQRYSDGSYRRIKVYD